MYRLVLATQPCTLASTTGYRVYWLVLAIQPCTLASTNGYRVYQLVLATQPCRLPQQLVTGYRVYRLVLATQPCTLASTTGYRLQSVPAGTGYTALYTCLNNWLQVTECTGWYWLHSLVHLLQQLVTVYRLVLATQPSTLASTTGYRVYRLVRATQPTGYKSTNRVLATHSLLKSASPQLVTYIKKKKKSWLNIDQ